MMSAMPEEEMLESEEAARRLGVKLATLYAYVSRGQLESYPVAGTRRRAFLRRDVEKLAARARHGKEVETRLVTVVTGVTHLEPDGPSYRGQPLRDLVGSQSYEDVAALLWRQEPDRAPWVADVGSIPDRLGSASKRFTDSDRLRLAVVSAAGTDPFRRDLRPDAMSVAARRIVASMVAALPCRAPGRVPRLSVNGRRRPDSIAQRLTAALATGPVSTALVAAVDAALVTMADHELATSTLAVRVAVSGRADLYDSVLAGLGALGGPLHGSVSTAARELLVDSARRGAETAIAAALADNDYVAGFGHAVYQRADPRADWLAEMVERLATANQRRVIASVQECAAARGLPPRNVEFVLGALAWVGNLVPEAGELILAIARTAGWTAHAIEELDEPPLRFRARAVYAQRT